jgi:hypothetical protein
MNNPTEWMPESNAEDLKSLLSIRVIFSAPRRAARAVLPRRGVIFFLRQYILHR